jgi:hypothetical protein
MTGLANSLNRFASTVDLFNDLMLQKAGVEAAVIEVQGNGVRLLENGHSEPAMAGKGKKAKA